MDLGIKGKVALVTAASKGLGRASAEALAAEGCNLAISSRTQADIDAVADSIRAAHGVRVLATTADVSSQADLERVVKQTESELGGIDIAVINTGGPPPGVFDALTEDAWAQGIDNTLMLVVRLVALVAPGMKERGWGRIVNITSLTAREPMPGLTISNALRPAIHGLVKDVSNDLAPHGITVNSVMPGLHATDRLMHVAEARNPADPQAALRELAKDVPAGRLGEPSDLAAAVAFLASEQAGYVTGTGMLIDGGRGKGI